MVPPCSRLKSIPGVSLPAVTGTGVASSELKTPSYHWSTKLSPVFDGLARTDEKKTRSEIRSSASPEDHRTCEVRDTSGLVSRGGCLSKSLADSSCSAATGAPHIPSRAGNHSSPREAESPPTLDSPDVTRACPIGLDSPCRGMLARTRACGSPLRECPTLNVTTFLASGPAALKSATLVVATELEEAIR